MPKRSTPLLFLLFLGLSITQCQSVDSSSAEIDTDTAAFTKEFQGDTCLFIAHSITDFDLWNASFELAESVRSKHGLKTISIYRDLPFVASEPMKVMVLTNVDDHGTALDYVTSEKLEESMKTAGVQGDMHVQWLAQTLEANDIVTDSLHYFMTFKVLSYDKWEAAFLSDDESAGSEAFHVQRVFRGVDNTDEVSLLFTSNDPDYVAKREGDGAFRMKMLSAGVVSYPKTFRMTLNGH